jgi:cytidylate kinase
LRPADDAITIDTSELDAATVLALALTHIEGVTRPE